MAEAHTRRFEINIKDAKFAYLRNQGNLKFSEKKSLKFNYVKKNKLVIINKLFMEINAV